MANHTILIVLRAGASLEWGPQYLYLLLMGCVASQLYAPISLQCRSSLFLKALTDVVSITVCGSLFHSFTMRRLKKCCLTVVRHLGLNDFMECPRKPIVTSASWKNVPGSIRSFPVKILNTSIKWESPSLQWIHSQLVSSTLSHMEDFLDL